MYINTPTQHASGRVPIKLMCAHTYDVGASKVCLDRLVKDWAKVNVKDVVRSQRQRRGALVDGEDAVCACALRMGRAS